MKRIALLLVVLASACKTTDSAPTPPASDPAPTTAAKVQNRAPAPALTPDQPAPAAGSDGELGGHRHHGPRDLDGDGKISPEERTAARKERTEKMRAKFDTNNDGKLTPDELAAMPGRMKFDDPAALDTNKDGDISADELQAAMDARREQFRAQHGARGGEPPDREGPPPEGN